MRCVRVFFTKLGESKYISHLDLMRSMSRAVRRARLPLWYTEGYNPHPYMTFALPLSLGTQSLCETMDIRLEGEMTNESVLEALRAVMPSGINITDVREPVYDPKEIAYGRFEISFAGQAQPEALCGRLKGILGRSGLTAEKLSKKGRTKVVKQVDVSSCIREYKVYTDGSRVIVEAVLPAGSRENVNPSLLADAICAALGESLRADILRKELLTADMRSFE